MLGKIIKYDLKAMQKDLLPMYLVEICIAILYKVFFEIGEHVEVIKYVSTIILFLYILTLIGIFLYTFIVSIKRFYNNMLKDEGYLTHTLPVKKWQLLLSKIIVSFIFLVITVIITLLALFIGFYEKGIIESIITAITNLSGFFGIEMLIYVALTLCLGYINYIMIAYFGLTLGFAQNSNKIGYSVLFAFVGYTIVQIVSSILFVIVIAINPELLNYTNSIEIPEKFFRQIMLLANSINIIVPVAYYFVINYVLKNKLNLE